MARKKKVRRVLGDVVAVPLEGGEYGFGRLLREPLMAFYNLKSPTIPSLDVVLQSPVAFLVPVRSYAVKDGLWPVVGNAALEPALLEEPWFFKQDVLSGALTLYKDSTQEEVPATLEECREHECAAVWEAAHIVDRLNDFFAGRPNRWLEGLRPS